jgi:hypothetical protein
MTTCPIGAPTNSGAGRDRPSVDHFRSSSGCTLDFEVARYWSPGHVLPRRGEPTEYQPSLKHHPVSEHGLKST